MPYAHPEPERVLLAIAQRKRLAAERREVQAAQLRYEADELERRWNASRQPVAS